MSISPYTDQGLMTYSKKIQSLDNDMLRKVCFYLYLMTAKNNVAPETYALGRMIFTEPFPSYTLEEISNLSDSVRISGFFYPIAYSISCAHITHPDYPYKYYDQYMDVQNTLILAAKALKKSKIATLNLALFKVQNMSALEKAIWT